MSSCTGGVSASQLSHASQMFPEENIQFQKFPSITYECCWWHGRLPSHGYFHATRPKNTHAWWWQQNTVTEHTEQGEAKMRQIFLGWSNCHCSVALACIQELLYLFNVQVRCCDMFDTIVLFHAVSSECCRTGLLVTSGFTSMPCFHARWLLSALALCLSPGSGRYPSCIWTRSFAVAPASGVLLGCNVRAAAVQRVASKRALPGICSVVPQLGHLQCDQRLQWCPDQREGRVEPRVAVRGKWE